MSEKWRIFPFLLLVWATQIHHLWTHTTSPELCLHFKAIVRHKVQYLFWFFPPLSPSSSTESRDVVCACRAGMYLCISKAATLSNHSLKVPLGFESSWKKKKIKKKCLFCLLDLLLLVSEYCASRKKSLNCWSRAFFQSLPRIKWLNKEAHRFHFLTEEKKRYKERKKRKKKE